MSRAAAILVLVSLHAAGLAGQEDIARDLLSADPSRVSAALTGLESASSPAGPAIVDPLLSLMVSGVGEPRRRAAALLARMGGEAVPPLTRAAEDGETRRSVVAIRLLAAMKRPELRPLFLKLLDDPRPEVTSEATRALYIVADPETDARMSRRLAALGKEQASKETDEETLARRYADTLYYVAMRRLPESYAALVDAVLERRGRAGRFALILLERFHADRFREQARRLYPSVRGEAGHDLLEFVFRSPAPPDRGIGIARRPKDAPWQEELKRLWGRTSTWAGVPVPPESLERLSYRITLKNRRSGAVTVRDRSTTPAAYDDRVYRGVDLHLPLGHLVTRPEQWAIDDSTWKTDRTITYRFRRPDPLELVFGLGDDGLGIWMGKETLNVRSCRSRFDAEGRPIRTTISDDAGDEIGSIDYVAWQPLEGDAIAPKLVRVETARFRFQTGWTWRPEGFPLLEESVAVVKERTPDGQLRASILATATIDEVAVETRSAPPGPGGDGADDGR